MANVKQDSNDKSPPDKGGKGGYIPYDTSLTAKARENRKTPTPAEKKFWYDVLKSHQFKELKFTRQKPLDNYIVDFYNSKLMIAVEIDGDSHFDQFYYDKIRTARLNDLGIKVIRYSNAEVMKNIEGVFKDFLNKIMTFE